MEGRHPDQASEHDDPRGTEPPAGGDPQDAPRRKSDERSKSEEGGPLGNPAVDEEALRHRQQDSRE
jgi:hypothetical protein